MDDPLHRGLCLCWLSIEFGGRRQSQSRMLVPRYLNFEPEMAIAPFRLSIVEDVCIVRMTIVSASMK